MKRRRRVAFFIILGLLLLLYGKNLLERQSFRNISSALTEVYEDRLRVESYIFHISEKLFQIQKLIDHCDLGYDYSKVIEEISAEEKGILELVAEFEATQLTPEEAVLLGDFKQIIQKDLSIKNYQLLYTDSSGVNLQQVKVYDQKIARAQSDLDKLSEIQIEEGEKLVAKAKTLINRSQIWAQFELALLLVLVVVIYFFLFKKPLFSEQG
ncbi:MAG: MCP four helix bundle domain-containing protein [Bacteroidota bacterium]|nr:MCP four helix bundle domain-containing protein [Algoriphagus sp.]